MTGGWVERIFPCSPAPWWSSRAFQALAIFRRRWQKSFRAREGRKLHIANCNSRGGGSQSCGPPGTWRSRAFQLLLTEIPFAVRVCERACTRSCPYVLISVNCSPCSGGQVFNCVCTEQMAAADSAFRRCSCGWSYV